MLVAVSSVGRLFVGGLPLQRLVASSWVGRLFVRLLVGHELPSDALVVVPAVLPSSNKSQWFNVDTTNAR